MAKQTNNKQTKSKRANNHTEMNKKTKFERNATQIIVFTAQCPPLSSLVLCSGLPTKMRSTEG